MTTHVLYECEICGGMHPWAWDGDCRDNANTYADEEDYRTRAVIYPDDDVEVRSMDERVQADAGDDSGNAPSDSANNAYGEL